MAELVGHSDDHENDPVLPNDAEMAAAKLAWQESETSPTKTVAADCATLLGICDTIQHQYVEVPALKFLLQRRSEMHAQLVATMGAAKVIDFKKVNALSVSLEEVKQECEKLSLSEEAYRTLASRHSALVNSLNAKCKELQSTKQPGLLIELGTKLAAVSMLDLTILSTPPDDSDTISEAPDPAKLQRLLSMCAALISQTTNAAPCKKLIIERNALKDRLNEAEAAEKPDYPLIGKLMLEQQALDEEAAKLRLSEEHFLTLMDRLRDLQQQGADLCADLLRTRQYAALRDLATQMRTLQTIDRAKLEIPKVYKLPILTNMRAFLTSPLPKDVGTVRSYITRIKSGMLQTTSTYAMYLENGDVLLMTSKKQTINKDTTYYIFLGHQRTGLDSMLGRLRSNAACTQFQLFDSGGIPGTGNAAPFRELGAVIFTKNEATNMRALQVALPNIESQNGGVHSDGILTRLQKGDVQDLIHFVNKAPYWNEQVKSHALDFKGRAAKASSKNFLLVDPDDQDTVVLLFGRVETDRFTVDLQYPLSPLQAFAVAIFACETCV